MKPVVSPDVGVPAAAPRGAAWFPALFVLLWSTGFIAAKYGLPYAPPLTLLALRFALASALLLGMALAARAAWPSRVEVGHLAIAGLLVHGAYLAGVYLAIKDGMEAGTSAMLVGLQPLLTVLLARLWLHERVNVLQWVGLLLGLVGVYFVVRHKITVGGAGLLPAMFALVGISVGTLYQKRHGAKVDLRTGSLVQYLVCAIVFTPLALFLDREPVQWNAAFVFAMAWLVIVLSVGAISLLYWMLRHGAASNIARLFYLVPPVTAVMAFVFFGERLDFAAIVGMALIAGGVALARPR